MTYRKPKIKYPEDQYVILEEFNEMWLVGSLSRAWAKKHMENSMATKLCCVLGTLSKDFVKTPLPVKTRGGSKKVQETYREN